MESGAEQVRMAVISPTQIWLGAGTEKTRFTKFGAGGTERSIEGFLARRLRAVRFPPFCEVWRPDVFHS